MILDMIFPHDWLQQKAPNDPQGRLNYDLVAEARSPLPPFLLLLTLTLVNRH